MEYWVQLGEYDRKSNQSTRMVPRIPGPLPPSLPGSDTLPTPTNAPIEQLRKGKAILYPDYFFKYHDIALIELEEPVS